MTGWSCAAPLKHHFRCYHQRLFCGCGKGPSVSIHHLLTAAHIPHAVERHNRRSTPLLHSLLPKVFRPLAGRRPSWLAPPPPPSRTSTTRRPRAATSRRGLASQARSTNNPTLTPAMGQITRVLHTWYFLLLRDFTVESKGRFKLRDAARRKKWGGSPAQPIGLACVHQPDESLHSVSTGHCPARSRPPRHAAAAWRRAPPLPPVPTLTSRSFLPVVVSRRAPRGQSAAPAAAHPFPPPPLFPLFRPPPLQGAAAARHCRLCLCHLFYTLQLLLPLLSRLLVWLRLVRLLLPLLVRLAAAAAAAVLASAAASQDSPFARSDVCDDAGRRRRGGGRAVRVCGGTPTGASARARVVAGGRHPPRRQWLRWQ